MNNPVTFLSANHFSAPHWIGSKNTADLILLPQIRPSVRKDLGNRLISLRRSLTGGPFTRPNVSQTFSFCPSYPSPPLPPPLPLMQLTWPGAPEQSEDNNHSVCWGRGQFNPHASILKVITTWKWVDVFAVGALPHHAPEDSSVKKKGLLGFFCIWSETGMQDFFFSHAMRQTLTRVHTSESSLVVNSIMTSVLDWFIIHSSLIIPFLCLYVYAFIYVRIMAELTTKLCTRAYFCLFYFFTLWYFIHFKLANS